MMPILGVIAGADATIFALQVDGAARGVAWARLVFIVLVVVASIAIAEPISAKFRRLPEGEASQRAEHYRTLWRRFHALRNLAALAALAKDCDRAGPNRERQATSTSPSGPTGIR
jgi:hypothetical protein